MEKQAKIYVAGHRGLVGSAIVRQLQDQGYKNLLLRTRGELDLLNQAAVADFFAKEKPEYVFLAAAKVGGILANDTYPADFIYQNLTIQTNIIQAAYENKVVKLLFLGSSCVYPKNAEQPMKEEYLLTGELEETNQSYSIAKIAGIIACQSYNKQYNTNFISVMPTNTYGPNDNFDPLTSHAMPGIIRKFHDAKMANKKTVTLWGSGQPRREFIYVDDIADACIFLMNNYNDSEIVNIGTGEDLTIADLANLIKDITGFEGNIAWDQSKPDGVARKLLDISKLQTQGWMAKTNLAKGIKQTYQWFLKKYDA